MRLQLTVAALAGSLALSAGSRNARADDEPVWRLTTDTLLYTDTDNVLVVSPQVAVHRALDDEGGGASARVVVDTVTAASVDIVSHATNRFSEVRTEVDLALSKELSGHLPSLSYRYSYEPDYTSHSFGGGYQREIGSSDTTLALGYNLSLDSVGFSGTPSSAFSESLTVHGISAALTQVLGPKTLVRGVYTLSILTGYMEKPYRFVPMFDQATLEQLDRDGITLDLSNFDRYRLSVRPAEDVPDRRFGNAVAVRLLRYVDWLPGSVRLDYQIFVDSWGLQAHTLEPAVSYRMLESLVLSAYARLYGQLAASFWRRAYVAEPGMLPGYRTVDRDLSEYYSASGGTRAEWSIGWLSAYVDFGAMQTYYTDYLFLERRLALIGQGGLRWQP